MSQSQKRLEDAFHTADQDNDDLLNKAEFAAFVKLAYNKPCPPAMYDNICSHFQCDPLLGVNFSTAKALSSVNMRSRSGRDLTSNTLRSPSASNAGSNSPLPSPSNSNSNHNRRLSLSLKTINSDTPTAPSAIKSPLSPLDDSGAQTPGAYHAVTNSNTSTNSNASASSSASTSSWVPSSLPRLSTSSSVASLSMHSMVTTPRRHRRESTLSLDLGAEDTSTMLVEVLQTKIKTLSAQLSKERTRRKKTEEIAQRLIDESEALKSAHAQNDLSAKRASSEMLGLKEQVRKFRAIVDDDRAALSHLKGMRNAMEAERDESISMMAAMSGQHSAAMRKVKGKHRKQMHTLTRGFLQSLGVDTSTLSEDGVNKEGDGDGKGGQGTFDSQNVTTLIKSLKTDNSDLNSKVDTLAVSLQRKQQSLWEALQAVDNIAMEDEKVQNELDRYRKGYMTQTTNGNLKERLSEWTRSARRKSMSEMFSPISTLGRRNSSTGMGMGMGMSLDVDGDSTARGFIGISGVDDEDVSPCPSPLLPSTPLSLLTGNKFAERRDSQILSAEFLKGSGLAIPPSPRRRAASPKSPSARNGNVRVERKVRVNNSKKAMMETAKHVKELQFLSQKLSSDVATKSQSIENLSTANTVLLEQMQRMKNEMEQMARKSGLSGTSSSRKSERGDYKKVSMTDME